MKLIWKLAIPQICIVICCGLISFIVINSSFRSIRDHYVMDVIDTRFQFINKQIKASSLLSVSETSVFVRMPAVMRAYEIALKGDIYDPHSPESRAARELLYKELAPMLSSYNDFIGKKLQLHFHLPSGLSLARLWRNPENNDGKGNNISDDISWYRPTVMDVNKNGGVAMGLEPGSGGFAIRGVIPVTSPDGKHLGSAESLQDFNPILDAATEEGRIFLSLYANKELLEFSVELQNAEKYPPKGDFVQVVKAKDSTVDTLVTPEMLSRAKHGTFFEHFGSMTIALFPLDDYRGSQVGVIVFAMDTKTVSALTRTASMIMLLMLIGMAMLPTFSLLIGLRMLVTKPVNQIKANIQAIAEDRADLNERIIIRQRDEIGELANWFNTLSAKLDSILSERQAMLGKIREESQKFETMAHWYGSILDSIPFLISVQDTEMKWTFVNAALAKLLGKKRDELIGLPCKTWGIEICGNESCSIACALRGKKQTRFLYKGMSYLADVEILKNLHGEATGYIEVIQDITPLEHLAKQEAEAKAANQAKSAFLANMSHEIRTPMNSIMGFSELAMEEAISEKAKEYLSRITENSKGLLQIVNDILDISKIESGSVELEIIPFDLHELLTTCKSAILPIALEKNIELYFYAESSIRRRLYGDPTRLRQVLFNLLSNAIKFTEAGKVSLYAGILDSTGESVTIRFRISDSGIGMTPEQISRIFEPFMQADISTTRKYGGTGLGLPITKSILDLMHSDLEIESTPGAGTIISFTLTLDAAKETEDHTESADAVNDLEKPTFHADVLVCEDNRMNQQVIIGHLSRVGLDAEIAENGLEGVEKVEQRIKEGKKPFDLIFMDIHMPVMDGLEATSRIIKLNTRVPIVAMTANIMTEDRETYKALGMDHYIGKPFSSQELWQCLLKYLKPEHTADADDDEKDEDDDVILQKQLMAEFARSNQNRFSDISRAIASSDLTLAHRLAHNLKSNAGLIGKQSLRNAAADVERVLADGSKTVKKELMDLLQNELSVVLEELRPYLSQSADPDLPERAAADIGMSEITEIFKALEPLLRSGSPESLKLLGKLRVVPGTGQMIEQMEDFRFGDALKTFNGLKEKLGIM